MPSVSTLVAVVDGPGYPLALPLSLSLPLPLPVVIVAVATVTVEAGVEEVSVPAPVAPELADPVSELVPGTPVASAVSVEESGGAVDGETETKMVSLVVMVVLVVPSTVVTLASSEAQLAGASERVTVWVTVTVVGLVTVMESVMVKGTMMDGISSVLLLLMVVVDGEGEKGDIVEIEGEGESEVETPPTVLSVVSP